jgi:hypothetical protein
MLNKLYGGATFGMQNIVWIVINFREDTRAYEGKI